MLSIDKYGEYFNEKIKDGDVVTFVKENNDPVKLEVINKKSSDFKITYRGHSILNNFIMQDFYQENCIDVLVNGKSIKQEVFI